jgi:hypothetical protein
MRCVRHALVYGPVFRRAIGVALVVGTILLIMALVTELAARERRTPARMALVLMLYAIAPVRWGRALGPKARDRLRVVRRRVAA